MSRALPWLPEQALGEPAAARPFGLVAAEWGRAWFAQARWQATGTWSPDRAAEPHTALREGERVAIHGGAGTILRLAFAMLGEDERPHLTTRDLRLLRRLAGNALDDLVTRLETALPARAVGGAPDSGHRGLALSMDGEPLLELTLDGADLCLLARGTFAATRDGAALAPATVAVADVTVAVSGRLGRAALAIDQIGALEPGDVLVLDREADEPVDLLVAGRDSPLRCDITEHDGAVGLVVREPN